MDIPEGSVGLFENGTWVDNADPYVSVIVALGVDPSAVEGDILAHYGGLTVPVPAIYADMVGETRCK